MSDISTFLVGSEDLEMVDGMRLQGRRCCECGKGPADKHCSRCKVTTYCSLECQKASWKAVHKAQCKPNPTKPLVLKKPTVFSAAAATSVAAWFVVPPHRPLKTREEIAELICRANPHNAGRSSAGSGGGVAASDGVVAAADETCSDGNAARAKEGVACGGAAAAAAAGKTGSEEDVVANAVDMYCTPRLAAACGFGPEDMGCMICLYASGGGGLEDDADDSAGVAKDNPTSRQLLNGVPGGAMWARGPMLVCMAATGSLDMEALAAASKEADVLHIASNLQLLPLSPAHIANSAMRRAEAAYCGGLTDRVFRLNMRRAELAQTARTTRLSGNIPQMQPL